MSKSYYPGIPRVLILLASHNGMPWIRQQLVSILDQVGVEVDILIGDDTSIDGTKELIIDFANSYPNINYIFFEESLLSAGKNFRNLILNANISGYDYVAFCDQDDVWSNTKLINAVNRLLSHGASGYSSSVNVFYKNKRQAILSQSPSIRKFDFLFEGAGQGATFLIEAAHFSEIQNFIKTNINLIENFFYHDWLLYLLTRASGRVWFFDNEPSMDYRQHGRNETGARNSISGVIKRLKMIRDGWYKKQILLAIRIYLLLCSASDTSQVRKLEYRLNEKKTFLRGVYLAIFFCKYGRRKFSDRAVMVLMVIFGWI